MKILFMGTPSYAATILQALIDEKYDIVSIFTQPDKPFGRKKILKAPEVKVLAIENGLEDRICQPLNLKDEKIHSDIKALNPDFIIVAAYGQILPKEILQIAPCLNLHASILPEFRGASPIQEAILEDSKFSGVTAMRMGEGLDDGDILGFNFIDIKDKNSNELFDEFALMAAKLILEVLKNWDEINPIKQSELLSSKCTKIKKEDGLVSFDDKVSEIYQKYLAYKDWPGIFLENGTKFLEIKKSNLKGQKGSILELNKNSFVLGFSDFSLEVFKIQEAGKKALNANEFINGKRLKLGNKIY